MDVPIDLDDPEVRRHVEQKRRLRERAAAASKKSADAAKNPGKGNAVKRPAVERSAGGAPGQTEVKKWVVLDLRMGKGPARTEYDPWGRGDDFTIAFEVRSASLFFFLDNNSAIYLCQHKTCC